MNNENIEIIENPKLKLIIKTIFKKLICNKSNGQRQKFVKRTLFCQYQIPTRNLQYMNWRQEVTKTSIPK